ncbi:MAG: pilus assembly protein PilP [Cellvibrionaceae bacterium]
MFLQLSCRAALTALLFITFGLVGCSSSGDHSDLREFMTKARNVPSSPIEPPPTFEPYEPFVYAAAGLHSPFEMPVGEALTILTGTKSTVKPDFNRPKEPLEFFGINGLKMVGTLEQDGVIWALIDDSDGGIHRVTSGNYIGKNHGRVVTTNRDKIELIEIVSDGRDGWLERPKTIQLSGTGD